MARRSIEWHFFDAASETEWHKLNTQPTDPTGAGNAQGPVWERRKMHFLYELIISVALLYGVVIYLLWQQTVQKLDLIAGEVATQRETVSVVQQSVAGKGQTIAYENGHAAFHLETAYLQFVVSPNAAEVVQAIAPHIDAQFQQLYRDWGLSLPAEKFQIFVGPTMNANYPILDEFQIAVGHPKFTAQRYGISEADALTTELLRKLFQKLLEQAIASRAVKPQWQGMTLALKNYVELEHGHQHNWQWEEVFLDQRYKAQSRSLTGVYDLSNDEEGTRVHHIGLCNRQSTNRIHSGDLWGCQGSRVAGCLAVHDSWKRWLPHFSTSLSSNLRNSGTPIFANTIPSHILDFIATLETAVIIGCPIAYFRIFI
ncbi:MAG: hypothetical protein R2911_10960 [Caldilineaceae bacterium]